MMQRIYLTLAALAAGRDEILRAYPKTVDRVDQCCVIVFLATMLYGFILLPLQYVLVIIHYASLGLRQTDVLYLDTGGRLALLLGGGAVLMASVRSAGAARTAMKTFEGHRWVLLLLATLALILPLIIGGIVTKSVALLGITRGDHLWIAVYLTAWSAAIIQICAAIVAPAAPAWEGEPFKRR
ncbi:hypothetical protein K7957_14885 [Sphingomonas yunnanensis]|uniref:hypothetical protein n=1 Tax=Sphingomonas yunnanensis TaxID=310400 RepID=UPI001CA69B96|nr:hypothetical protein [Sphingomonas yunnanensis]MBY9064225.1 hypothetical protein [Sphingomonas yunnanensis]